MAYSISQTLSFDTQIEEVPKMFLIRHFIIDTRTRTRTSNLYHTAIFKSGCYITENKSGILIFMEPKYGSI